jgi:hypothetical protein
MGEFNETLVRRYFELDGYLVRTNVRYPVPNGYSDVDLVGLNPRTGDAVRDYLSQRHVDVIDFPAVLTRLMADANPNKNADSDAEHLLRLLRIYGYLAPPSK